MVLGQVSSYPSWVICNVVDSVRDTLEDNMSWASEMSENGRSRGGCIYIYIYASLSISHIITCFGTFFDKQSFVTFCCASRLWSSVSSHLVIGHILALALLELRVSIAWLLRYIGLSCSGTNGHGHQDTDVDDSRNLAARSELAKPCRIEGHAVHCLKVSIDLIDFVWTSKGWTLHYLIWHYIGHW